MTALLHIITALAYALPATTIGVIGDTQARPEIFRRAVRDMRRARVNFAIHLGDLAHCASRQKWQRAVRIMWRLDRPWYHTIGNHEILRCPGTYDPGLRRLWVRYFGPTFHQYRPHGQDHTFVHLDSATAIPRSQLAHLADLARSTPVIVATHRPPGAKLAAVIRDRPTIRAIFHGHDHKFRAYTIGRASVYCTGGGGGDLDRGGFYHWLHVRIVGPFIHVSPRPIRRQR